MSLGDFNLTETEVRDHNLSRSLVKHRFYVAANEGVKDKQGRLHQDLVLVDADRVPDVTLTPIRSDVRGFDGVHQAVQARICSQGPAAAASAGQVAASAAASASPEVAASAAASTRGIPPPPPGPKPPAPQVAAVAQPWPPPLPPGPKGEGTGNKGGGKKGKGEAPLHMQVPRRPAHAWHVGF